VRDDDVPATYGMLHGRIDAVLLSRSVPRVLQAHAVSQQVLFSSLLLAVTLACACSKDEAEAPDGSAPRDGGGVDATTADAGPPLDSASGEDGGAVPSCAAALGSALPPLLAESTGAVHYVAMTGADDGPGTLEQPWRTVEKAFAALGPGETAYVRAGTYGARGTRYDVSATGAPGMTVTIRGYPGDPRPVLLGFWVVTGTELRLSGFVFDGPTGDVGNTQPGSNGEEVLLWIQASDGLELSSSELRNDLWRGGIFVSGSHRVFIVGNDVRDNGDRSNPDEANLQHGIYWAGSGPGLIANNVFDHNYAFGVHLYPDADGVIVTGNTLLAQGRSGVIVSGDATSSSDDCIVVNNVAVFNDQYGIRDFWGGPEGTGDVARTNLVFGNTEGETYATVMTIEDSVEADPGFVDRAARDYHLAAGSAAIDRGLPEYALPYDHDGRCHDATPDLGAFER